MKAFEFLEHTADIKFRINAKDINGIFENTVLAVSDIISRGKKIKPTLKKEIEVSGDDYESLLYNFIDELIYLVDAEGFVPSNAEINVWEGKKIARGTLYGDKTENYKELDHIKSATYAEMFMKKVKGKGWQAQAVVDV